MALWIKTRPDDMADPSELAVADRLSHLPDDWLVVWGFYFSTNRGGGLDREGDFIVQSPGGQVLVIEVKGSSSFRRFVETGVWESEDRKDPREQLNAECQSVIAALHAAAGESGPIPTVSKALALPRLSRHDYDAPGAGWEGTHLLDHETLEFFHEWWTGTFGEAPANKRGKRARELMRAAFAKETEPTVQRHFATMTDRMLMRFARAEFHLLDQLAENPRFAFTGGPGTGKTFFAAECARRFAESGEGRAVLMPVFNLPLCHSLRGYFAKTRLARGSVTVLSQEETAQRLLAQVGRRLEFPDASASGSDRSEFFRQTLPKALAQALALPGIAPDFDALVVDEAQDHDTSLPGIEDGGWWKVYLNMLRHPETAPVAISHDAGQRALFRSDGVFDPATISRLFPGAVRVRLDRCVRYTDAIHRYLRRSAGLTVESSPDALLPAGPDVVDETVAAADMPAAIARILDHWARRGVISRPEHVLLLSPHRSLSRTSLAGTPALADAPLVEFDASSAEQSGCLRHLNVHRAKGLDERAVILFDLLPPESAPDPALARQNHLLGASRARQALAVFWLKPQ